MLRAGKMGQCVMMLATWQPEFEFQDSHSRIFFQVVPWPTYTWGRERLTETPLACILKLCLAWKLRQTMVPLNFLVFICKVIIRSYKARVLITQKVLNTDICFLLLTRHFYTVTKWLSLNTSCWQSFRKGLCLGPVRRLRGPGICYTNLKTEDLNQSLEPTER